MGDGFLHYPGIYLEEVRKDGGGETDGEMMGKTQNSQCSGQYLKQAPPGKYHLHQLA
jgi:hypothetical protein